MRDDDLYYRPFIKKIDDLLKTWKHRSLTPVGKVTILKTLVIPKLNHLLISLPSPSDNYIQQLDDFL